MEKIAAALFVGVLVGASAVYWLIPKPNDARMKELEQQIAATQQELTQQQQISKERLDRLDAIEEQKKLNDKKMKGALYDLEQANKNIDDVFDKLEKKIQILRKALCNYSNDFCTSPAHGGSSPS